MGGGIYIFSNFGKEERVIKGGFTIITHIS